MSTTKYTATDKDPSNLPPQARAIVKAAKNGATKERVLKALEGGDTTQKPGRILSYYKTRLVDEGYLTVEEKEKKQKPEKPAKTAKVKKVAKKKVAAVEADSTAASEVASAEVTPPAS